MIGIDINGPDTANATSFPYFLLDKKEELILNSERIQINHRLVYLENPFFDGEPMQVEFTGKFPIFPSGEINEVSYLPYI